MAPAPAIDRRPVYAIVVAVDDPLDIRADDRDHPWENVERMEHLLIEAHGKLTVLMAAMEEEICKAVENGDTAGVGMMAWEYGPVASLVTEIEMRYGNVLPMPT